MIQRIGLKNYQCHERKDIELDPTITTIVGPSDTGKSAVIRALRWLTLNRPRGIGFVKDGAQSAEVRVKIDDHLIQRKRTKTKNQYLVDGKILSAVGTDVPESIQNLMRMDDVNFSGQHDPPFWFDLTPGEVAKRLNEIVDLGLIDRVTGDLASRLRKHKAEEQVIKERLEEAEVEKKELKFVPLLDADLVEVERFQEEWDDASARMDALAIYVQDGKKYQEILKSHSGAILVGSELISQGAEILEDGERKELFFDLVEKAKRTKSIVDTEIPDMGDLDDQFVQLGENQRQLNSLEDLVCQGKEAKEKVDVEIPDMSDLEDQFAQLDVDQKRLEDLVDLVEEYQDQRGLLIRAKRKLKDAGEQLEEETEGLCPLCGGELNE